MTHWSRSTLAAVFALSAFSAYAQASRFVGNWTVEVQGSPRQLAMAITQEGDTLHVSWGLKDQEKLPAVESQLAAAPPVSNTSKAAMPIAFQPYQLVGDWNFVNSSTGTKYGGAIEVDVKAMDSNGTMHGLISYDGRQTNDKCGTKPLFTDKPVEAEIVKSANDYRIAFQVNCSIGAGPRLITWTLTCDDKGDCTAPDVVAWGRGRKLLREVRK